MAGLLDEVERMGAASTGREQEPESRPASPCPTRGFPRCRWHFPTRPCGWSPVARPAVATPLPASGPLAVGPPLALERLCADGVPTGRFPRAGAAGCPARYRARSAIRCRLASPAPGPAGSLRTGHVLGTAGTAGANAASASASCPHGDSAASLPWAPDLRCRPVRCPSGHSRVGPERSRCPSGRDPSWPDPLGIPVGATAAPTVASGAVPVAGPGILPLTLSRALTAGP